MLFSKGEVAVEGVTTIYRIFEPRDLDAPLPLILFLHGAGESGADGALQTTVGLGPAIARDPQRFPALCVFPQASRGYGWRGFNLAAAIAALDDVEKTFHIDQDRVYVTGISMGGYGTWLLALEQPERFAGIVPVCGGFDEPAVRRSGLLDAGSRQALVAKAAARIAKIPHWVFHGDEDNIIPVEESRAMVRALRSAGADVQYTEYAGVRHNSWDRAYGEAELMPWLLGRRRRGAGRPGRR